MILVDNLRKSFFALSFLILFTSCSNKIQLNNLNGYTFGTYYDIKFFSESKNFDESDLDEEAEKEMELLQEIVTGIRTVRGRMNVPPLRKSALIARCNNSMTKFLQAHQTIILTLAQTSSIVSAPNQLKPEQSATVVVGQNELYVPLGGLIDLGVERLRLQKRSDEINGHLRRISKKLSNEQFISKAPEEVVFKERKKQEDMLVELEKTNANLEMLQ